MSLEPLAFDVFTGSEATLMEAVMADLATIEWAKPLIDSVDSNGGLVGANKDRFFELRFANALHRAGISAKYEAGGEGDSTIDFSFVSQGQKWLVELMHLSETKAALEATAVIDVDGIQMTKRSLNTNAENPTQSIEGETLKTVQRICQKCEFDGKPHKFPLPNDAFHVILVDMRTFLNGGDLADRVHIALGTKYVEHPALRAYWQGKPILGIFDKENKMKGAAELRDRVHFVGFVRERSYSINEFGESIQFFANPHLFRCDNEAAKVAMATWPLQPASLMNAG